MWLLLTVNDEQTLINTDRVSAIVPYNSTKGTRLWFDGNNNVIIAESLEEIYDKIRTTSNR